MTDKAKIVKQMMAYDAAQKEAEKAGKHEFTCPLCGGNAWWERAKINNHLHTFCDKCGFGFMQ